MKACTGLPQNRQKVPTGKNCPAYGYHPVNGRVNAGLQGARNVAGRLRGCKSIRADLRLLDQRRDPVVLRIDDQDLVVLDQDGMRLDLRHLGGNFDRHRLERNA